MVSRRVFQRFFLDCTLMRAMLREMFASQPGTILGCAAAALALHTGCLESALCQRTDASCDPLAAYFLYYEPFVNAPCQGAGAALESYFTFVAGGSNQANDYALCATSDGGLLFAGTTNTNLASLFGKTPAYGYGASTEILIAKLDSAGGLDWYGYLGEAGAQSVRAVTETSDGAFVIAGTSNTAINNLRGKGPLYSYQGSGDWFISRIDARGALQWFSFFGDAANSDAPLGIDATVDGGAVIVGTLRDGAPAFAGLTPVHPPSGAGVLDVFAVKIDAAGQIAWHTFLGGAAANEVAQAVARTADGGYVIGASSDADIPSIDGKTPLNPILVGGASAALALKLNASGALQWYTFLGGAGDEIWRSVSAMDNGDAVFAGLAQVDIPSVQGQAPINASTATEDFLAARYDPNGALRWYTFLGGGGFDDASAVVQTRDGGVVVGGYAGANIPGLSGKTPNNPYTASTDAMLAQLDGFGRLQWYTFAGGAGAAATGRLVASRNGGFWFLGYSSSNIPGLHGKLPLIPYTGITDMLLLKFKPDGVL
jgi:hypothetical protein